MMLLTAEKHLADQGTRGIQVDERSVVNLAGLTAVDLQTIIRQAGRLLAEVHVVERDTTVWLAEQVTEVALVGMQADLQHHGVQQVNFDVATGRATVSPQVGQQVNQTAVKSPATGSGARNGKTVGAMAFFAKTATAEVKLEMYQQACEWATVHSPGWKAGKAKALNTHWHACRLAWCIANGWKADTQ